MKHHIGPVLGFERFNPSRVFQYYSVLSKQFPYQYILKWRAFPLSPDTAQLNTPVYLLESISLGKKMHNISAGFVKFASAECEKYLRQGLHFNCTREKNPEALQTSLEFILFYCFWYCLCFIRKQLQCIAIWGLIFLILAKTIFFPSNARIYVYFVCPMPIRNHMKTMENRIVYQGIGHAVTLYQPTI